MAAIVAVLLYFSALVSAGPGENNLIIVGGRNSDGLLGDLEIVEVNTNNPTCVNPPSLPM